MRPARSPDDAAGSTSTAEQGPADRALVFAVLVGPIAWALQLQVQYGATPFLCGSGWTPVLHLVTLLALGATLAGLVIARRAYGRLAALHTGAGAGGVVPRRQRVMALAGGVTSGFFVVVILVQGLPALLLDPCLR